MESKKEGLLNGQLEILVNLTQPHFTPEKINMKKILYKIILVLILFSLIKCKIHAVDNKNNSKYYSEIKMVLKPKYFKNYEVIKIDSSLLNNNKENDVYQFYAKKNDTIIKIISFKNKRKPKFHIKIKLNGIYDFTLITLNPEKYVDEGRGTMGIGGSTVSNSKGVYTFFNYEKDSVYDVFQAKNLKGLYIKRGPF